MAVWLGDGEMAVEYGSRTLSRYNVSLSWDAAKLEAVTNPRLFPTPYRTTQPKLFAPDALGEGGWLKALRVGGYADRASAPRGAAAGAAPLSGGPLAAKGSAR